MRAKLRSQFSMTAVLIFLVLLTPCHPRPFAALSTSAVDSAQTGQHTSATSIPSIIQHDERIAATGLGPRALGFHQYLDIGGGWNMYYSSWPSIALPVRPAAWALTHLYASILVHARGKWTTLPPQHGFTLTYGGIQVVMHCAQKPIPWLFVGNFAEKLLSITQGGWTGVYQVMLSQAEGDVSIGVQLSVVP